MAIGHVFASLRFRLLIAIITMLAALGGGIMYNGYRLINDAMVENVRVSVKQTSQILNLAVSPFAVADDIKTLHVYLAELIGEQDVNRGLDYVAIAREDGNLVLVAGNPTLSRAPAPDPPEGYAEAVERGVVHVRQPLLLADNSVGFLQYGLSTRLLHAATRESVRQGMLLVGLGLLLSVAAVLYVGFRYSGRIDRLIAASAAIANGEYGERAPEVGGDEIAQLAHHFNVMAGSIRDRIAALEDSRTEIVRLNTGLERRVEERTAELAEVNQQLEQTIDNLRRTQESLVHSEKLASLGALVAGVAHELNTPLGNALTAASTLQERTDEFLVEVESGLRRSTLNSFIEMVRASSPLITRNLVRAADMITSFKHVAVDQTSSQRRRFDLALVIKEVTDTLSHTFRKTPFRLEIDIPEGIELDSYPGPLGQVITNLINNALVHAFEGRDQGLMRISAQRDRPDWVVLVFTDDGRGIPPENLKHIFDPFFTTRLGQGGSGLGLNIVHNIVEGLLGGNLQVESTLGVCTCFSMDLPRVAPLPSPA
jgi:signal transduction histidine kinase